jgi:single-stranded-DNA-specific exonuclease
MTFCLKLKLKGRTMSNFIERLEKKLKLQTKDRVSGLKLKDLPPLESLKNCKLAAKIIVDKLMKGERMLLVGDYDADGILATTVIMSLLKEAGFSEGLADYLIPSRLKDGYGVSTNIVEYAKENNYNFIVTVDNGIAANEAIDLANEYGIPVIITDHHTAPEKLPNAEIIVNPRVPGETFPFPWISGATVAWYVATAIVEYMNIKIDMRKYLDLVAITVISDVMPLDNINLAILSYGLEQIKERKRYLYQLIWNDWSAPTINTTEISFSLVPMINAIGRINDANIGVKLFMSKKKTEIKELFDQLKEINETRKEMSRKSVKDAENYIDNFDLKNDSVIIVRNKEFHEGIVGIIAGKLAEKYQKPAYVFSYNEEKGIWKGSARSVGNIHLYDLTNKARDYILGFGGHKGAVGLAVTEENFESFSNALKEAGEELSEEDFVNEALIPIDCEISDINEEILELLSKYGPYGNGNPEPVFISEGVSIKIEREMKGGLHYKATVSDENSHAIGLFFNVEKEEFLTQLEENEESTILFYPSLKYDLRTDKFSHELICTLL